MTQCPSHPHTLGATLHRCAACAAEATIADHAAGAQAVREALRANRPARRDPVETARDRALDRARQERIEKVRRTIDQEAQP